MEGDNATVVIPRLVVFSTYGERQLIAGFLCIITMAGTLGNCLVLLAVVLSRKLRTVPNIFVVNLSVADLITSLSMSWQAVAVLSVDEWPLPGWLCSAGALGALVPMGCSLNTLTLIAINRFVIVTRTKSTYQRMYRTHWIALMVSTAWIYPVAVISIPLVSDFVQLGFDKTFGTCAWDTSNPNAATYALFLSIASYPVQLCTIITCYLALFVRVYKHNRTIGNALGRHEQQVRSAADPIPNMSDAASVAHVQLRRNNKRRQTEVTKNLFYVVCAFFVCTTPYAICIMRTDTYKLLPYATVILFVNSCLNPFIYATKYPDFRKVFGCILRCKFRSISERIF